MGKQYRKDKVVWICVNLNDSPYKDDNWYGVGIVSNGDHDNFSFSGNSSSLCIQHISYITWTIVTHYAYIPTRNKIKKELKKKKFLKILRNNK